MLAPRIAVRMLAAMRRVHVPLGGRGYDIFLGNGLIRQLGQHCHALGLGGRCAVITDRKVAPLYGPAALASLESSGFVPNLVTVPSGERAKCLNEVERCCDALARHRLERSSFVVALGGGVVGDLAGFVAASYLRGIPFIQVPTTLLAQVDSSVGGKVGINLKAGKNLVGAFYQPRLVLCDGITLRTLPTRELRAGLAEVIKYGVIHDAALFDRLERDMDQLREGDLQRLEPVVERCCQIKAEVVSKDETESGLRAILNFGHTVGHAIENSIGYGRLRHGEAIAIGQVVAAWLSVTALGMPEAQAERIRRLIARAGLPTTLPLDGVRRARLWRTMQLDKKVQAGQIRFVLAERIGRARFGNVVSQTLVDQALDRVSAGTGRGPASALKGRSDVRD